jgi:DNA-binding transcriptional LysR family regulator
MPYGIQQPAISGQLSQLEKTLGIRLFHRRPFGLTSAGETLFGEIERFFAGLSELPHQLRGHVTQRLRLAAPATILRDYLPGIFVGYKRRYRDFHLTLHDANQAIAEELLRKREIDVAITGLEGRPVAPISSRVLLRLPLVLLVPAPAKFRSLNEIFRSGTPSESLISLPPNEVISKHFQSGLRQLGLSWPASIEVSSLELIDLYTSLGFGVGLSIAMPKQRRKPKLRALPLRNFSPLSIAALWIGEPSGPSATFLNDIQKLAARSSRERS